MKWILLILALSPLARAVDRPVTCSGSINTTLQTAATASADNDTITLSAGSCSVTTVINMSCASWTLQGMGSGVTNLTFNNAGGARIAISACSGKSPRITGINFKEQAIDANGMINIAGGSGISYRIDHNALTASGSFTRAIWLQSPCASPGCVVDHNTLTDVGYIIKNVAPGDVHLGDASWAAAMFYETVNTVYFEDNDFTFTADRDMDCAEGCRLAFRHNSVVGTTFGNHGYDSVDNGAAAMDAYSNDFNGNGTAFIGIQSRGGPGIWYDNLIHGSYSGNKMGITNYRSDNACVNAHDLCDGTGVEDQNTAPNGTNHGWHCYEQIGMGSPATGFNSFPLYEFNNCITALGCTAGGADQVTATVYDNCGGTSFVTSVLHANRDFYDQVAAYNGTVGIGRGLLASRPGTCTAGVGYFATDTTTLYQCGAGNTWSSFYRPFTYPHPLVTPTPITPYSAPISPVVSPFRTIDMNSNSQWPDGVTNTLVRMDCFRAWDLPGASGWAQIETTPGNYVFTTLDTVIRKAQANGVNCMFYPLNRTPGFYSSNRADTICGYGVSIGSGTVNTVGTAVTRVTGTTFLNTWTAIIINGVYYTFTFISGSSGTLGSSAGTQTGVAFTTPSTNAVSDFGQCDMPTDINTDGSGTDLHHKNAVAAIATHLKTTFPTLKVYYESYNEPDTCKFFNSDTATQGSCSGTGTIAELQRWQWETYCLIKGTSNNNPFVGGQSCATSQGLVTSVVMAGAIDPTAEVEMGSYHGAPFSYNLAQNFLYCNHAPVPTNCPGRTGADYTNDINFHFKFNGKPAAQGDASTVLENVALNWLSGAQAILQPNELKNLPFDNTEGGSAAGGWVDCTPGVGVPTCNFLSEPLMESSTVARNNAFQVWLGIRTAVFYDCTYSGGNFCLGGVNDSGHLADKAYDISGQWLAGATGMVCLTSAPGTAKATLYTWTCTFRNGQNQAKAMIWDNSQTCSGTCSTTTQTVASSYTSYSKLDGSAPVAIVSHQVPVGINPILLNVDTSSSGIGGVTLKGLTAKVGTPLGPPTYPGSSRSVAALGTISSPFSAATLFNSTAHGPLNPGTNCITRFIDQNVVQFGTSTHLDDNFSQGNLTKSGGNNDVMTNTDTSYIGIGSNGGTTWIFQTSQSGGCLLNNTDGGQNPNFNVPGPFGFSRITPLKFYNLVNEHLLNVNTIVPGTPLTFTTAGSPFDFTDCPGVAALVAHGTIGTSGSILGIALNDALISADISWDGGQGTAHFGMVYKPGTGCATLDLGPTALLSGTASIVANVATVTTAGRPNMAIGLTAAITGASNTNFNCATATITNSTASTVSYTCSPALTNTGSLTLTTGTMIGNFGNMYGFCNASCATAVPLGSETVCFDPAYASGSGVHDGNITLDGSILRLAGGCQNLLVASSAFWQINTTNIMGRGVGTSTCVPGNGYAFGGHPSDGVNHILQSNDPNPNIRTESTVCGDFQSYTTLATLPNGASNTGGFHGAWAHPNGDDSLAWTMESANNVGFTTPGSMTLTFLENEIFGLQVDNSLQPFIRFGPTYNSSNSGSFGCQDGIGYVSQDGKWAFFLFDGFQNLGLDSAGNQLCSVGTMALQ